MLDSIILSVVAMIVMYKQGNMYGIIKAVYTTGSEKGFIEFSIRMWYVHYAMLSVGGPSLIMSPEDIQSIASFQKWAAKASSIFCSQVLNCGCLELVMWVDQKKKVGYVTDS